MKPIDRFPDQNAIEAEACAWIAQLDGDTRPSEEDVAALREWINRSPLHRAELERLSDLWGDLNILTKLAVPLRRVAPESTRHRINRLFAIPVGVAAFSASLVIGITALFLYLGQADNTVRIDAVYTTDVGQQQQVTLPDGSSIELNTDTQLAVDFDRDRRNIRLLRGEAYFDVAHDSKRPFVVYAGTGRVRAVGTAFSVKIKARTVDVTVTDGRVELASVKSQERRMPESETNLAVLKAGQSAQLNGSINRVATVEKAAIARKLSWRDGILVFSGESLGYVVEEVGRYTAIDIQFSDPTLREVPIGGYFRVGETEALFDALESSFGIEVVRVDDSTVRLSPTNPQEDN